MHIGIIAKLNGEKTELSARIEKIDRAIILMRELDGPSELSEPDPPDEPGLCTKKCPVCKGSDHHWLEDCDDQGNPIYRCKHCSATKPYELDSPDETPARRKYKKRKVKKPKPKHIAGLRGPRKKVSKYKGVSRDNPRKDGSRKWRAQYWDGVKKKPVSLGMFERELLAAAAYQDHEGNKAKAAEYRRLDKQQRKQASHDKQRRGADDKQQQADMAEQAENNPDREKVKSKKVKGKKYAYKCNNPACGLEWQTKPSYCPGAGCYGTSFKKIEVIDK